METLKDRINRKREEVSDRTYDGQRENTDADMVNDLRDEVKRLASCVDDTNHRTNYHEVELNELNAALDIIIEAVSVLQSAVIENRKLKTSITNIAARLVRDEELIGIDDESPTNCLGDNVTVLDLINDLQTDIEDFDAELAVRREPDTESVDELRSEIVRVQATFAGKIDAITDHHDKELVLVAKVLSKEIEDLQDQIDQKLPKE